MFGHGLKVSQLDGLVHNLLRLVFGHVSKGEPKHASFLKPLLLHGLEGVVVEGVEDFIQRALFLVVLKHECVQLRVRQSEHHVEVVVFLFLQELLFDLVEDFAALDALQSIDFL